MSNRVQAVLGHLKHLINASASRLICTIPGYSPLVLLVGSCPPYPAPWEHSPRRQPGTHIQMIIPQIAAWRSRHGGALIGVRRESLGHVCHFPMHSLLKELSRKLLLPASFTLALPELNLEFLIL